MPPALESAASGRTLDENDYAYWRYERQFTNYTWSNYRTMDRWREPPTRKRIMAVTIARNFLYATLMAQLWPLLEQSSDAKLAAIAAKSVKENRYHMHHAQDWLVRLATVPQTSHRTAAPRRRLITCCRTPTNSSAPMRWKMRWPLMASAVRGADLKTAGWPLSAPRWHRRRCSCRPPGSYTTTGKLGLHSEHMGYLLAELQSVARQHPGAQW